MEKLLLTHELYNEHITRLADKIKASGKTYKCVYGIPRGGYYVAINLARLLNLQIVTEIKNANTLVVDDICDSGYTLAHYKEYDTAVVFCRPYSFDKCTYYGTESPKGQWIVFPDENGETVHDNIRRIFEYIGEDPNRTGLLGTPDRIVRMWKEIFRGYDKKSAPKITVFPNGEDGIVYDSMVIDEGDYYSMCEHHMMPFFGHYWFAYIPNPKGKILGISKIGRVVDYCAARLQVQERLTHDIVDMLEKALGADYPPLGIALVMRGSHLCKEMRGVKKKGIMTSSFLTGAFKTDAETRAEFMNFVNKK